ncbi:transposase, partial [Shewanella sp. SM87]|uniref:transposase n=1 Tax=Shewanella sp. SM87 TaxID=2912808 RepID=UPI0021DB64BB
GILYRLRTGIPWRDLPKEFGHWSTVFRLFTALEQVSLGEIYLKSVIPRRRYKNTPQERVDWCLYRYRHLVENAFGRIKHYRAISTRYDKLARNYASMVSLAFMLMWLPIYC